MGVKNVLIIWVNSLIRYNFSKVTNKKNGNYTKSVIAKSESIYLKLGQRKGCNRGNEFVNRYYKLGVCSHSVFYFNDFAHFV